MCVQRAWRRFAWFAHARRWKVRWDGVRTRLRLHRVWPRIAWASHVRREWRLEAPSWEDISALDAALVAEEVRLGLWGRSTPRLLP